MMTALLITLLTGLPEIHLTDERCPGGDPTEVRISLINRTEKEIPINFDTYVHTFFFVFRLYDVDGRLLKLKAKRAPYAIEGESVVRHVKPGELCGGYVSPRANFEVPPGWYQIEAVYFYRPPGGSERKEVVSNRITKIFP